MKTYKLTIPGRFPGLNEYIKAERSNRFFAAEIKKTHSDMVYFYAISQLKNVKILEPVRINFHWFEPNKRRDLDNIAFGKKFILDGLVKSGVLSDDGQKNIRGLSDYFSVDKENPRIEVEIIIDEEV